MSFPTHLGVHLVQQVREVIVDVVHVVLEAAGAVAAEGPLYRQG